MSQPVTLNRHFCGGGTVNLIGEHERSEHFAECFKILFYKETEYLSSSAILFCRYSPSIMCVQYMEVFSTLEGYRDVVWGYPEYIEGCSVH